MLFLFFCYRQQNEISAISGWGPVPGDVLNDGTTVNPYIKPALVAPGGATSSTAPRVAACLAVLESQNPGTVLDTPDHAKQILFGNHVRPLPGHVVPNKIYGRGMLFMDWRSDWHDNPLDQKGIVCFPNPSSLVTEGSV